MKAGTNRTSYVMLVFAVLLFSAVVVWFVIATDNANQASEAQRLQTVTRSVEDAITLCYSIEGAYPESLEYLAENYGVSYDKELYIVHYECFASNIRPNVTVIGKESSS